MNGFGVLVRKELLEAWRTRRLPVVAVLFAVFGMLSPLTARFLPEIVELLVGDQIPIPLPTPTGAMAVRELQENLGQLGALAAIALAMGSVAGELDRGTAALVLAQPAGRPAFLAAKLVAIGLVLAVSTAIAVAVGWVYTAVLFEPLPVGGWLALAVLTWLTLGAWAGITFLASAATGSALGSAGLGVAALFGLSIVAVIPALDRVLPTGLGVPALLLASGDTATLDVGALASAILGTVAIIALALGAALVVFRRREL